MGFSNRYLFISLFVVLAIGVSLPACSNGSSEPNVNLNKVAFTPGVYEIDVKEANVHCSDESRKRNGYIVTGELRQDGDFLSYTRDGEIVGRGHVEADGAFHISGSIEDPNGKYAVVLDGWSVDTGLTGFAKTTSKLSTGLVCSQVAEFAGTAVEAGQ